MMSNERQRQVSTPMVVAKDNLTKGYPFQIKKKIINTYLKRLTHTTDYAARTQCLEFSPKWTDEKMK